MAILNDIKEKIKKLIEVVPKKVLFGSDYSGCSQKEYIQFVKNLELNKKLTESIFAENAKYIFKLIFSRWKKINRSSYSDKNAGIFREFFNEIMLKCIQVGLVFGETGVADGSFLPSNVSWDSRYEVVETVNRSTIKYMEELEEELASMPGYRKAEHEKTEKESPKSRTDP